MNSKLQVIKSEKNLADTISDLNTKEQQLILCTQTSTSQKTLKSLIFSKANILGDSKIKNFSQKNWSDISDAIKYLADSSILFVNLNRNSIGNIISKYKSGKLKAKNILTDNPSKLKTYKDYNKLELLMKDFGINLITCHN